MAQGKKYTEQFAFVATAAQGAIVDKAVKRAKIDKAPIMRKAFNQMVGLGENDELLPGDTIEAATDRLVAIMTQADASAV